MSIFGFVRESKKNRVVPKEDLKVEDDVSLSPFDQEPDTPEDLEKMLARTFEKALAEDPFADENAGARYILHTFKAGESPKSLVAIYSAEMNDVVAINGASETWFVGQILCLPTSEIILEVE